VLPNYCLVMIDTALNVPTRRGGSAVMRPDQAHR